MPDTDLDPRPKQDDFLDRVADQLAALRGVEAVSLGGSRAAGTHRPDSDWDLAIYYRGAFEPQDLRDIGWPGEVSEIGGWGGGVFNGGAWLQIDGYPVDVHYRDLDVVEHELAEAQHGRFRIEPLLFHLAGIPSYLVVGELAINKVLRGDLPAPDYPTALSEKASQAWWANAQQTFAYAATGAAPYGRVAQCAGLIALAATQAAHAVHAARGEWTTNEKTLLTNAGLRDVDGIVVSLSAEPERLRQATEQARVLCEGVVRADK
jgi:predicted nucleotidyltransferase